MSHVDWNKDQLCSHTRLPENVNKWESIDRQSFKSRVSILFSHLKKKAPLNWFMAPIWVSQAWLLVNIQLSVQWVKIVDGRFSCCWKKNRPYSLIFKKDNLTAHGAPICFEACFRYREMLCLNCFLILWNYHWSTILPHTVIVLHLLCFLKTNCIEWNWVPK